MSTSPVTDSKPRMPATNRALSDEPFDPLISTPSRAAPKPCPASRHRTAGDCRIYCRDRSPPLLQPPAWFRRDYPRPGPIGLRAIDQARRSGFHVDEMETGAIPGAFARPRRRHRGDMMDTAPAGFPMFRPGSARRTEDAARSAIRRSGICPGRRRSRSSASNSAARGRRSRIKHAPLGPARSAPCSATWSNIFVPSADQSSASTQPSTWGSGNGVPHAHFITRKLMSSGLLVMREKARNDPQGGAWRSIESEGSVAGSIVPPRGRRDI